MHSHFLSRLMFVVTLLVFQPESVRAADVFGGGDEFLSNKVDDSELSNMRGGFSFGGVNFDFVLNTRAMIDGQLVHDAVLNSAELQNFDPQSFQQMIQVGDLNGITVANLENIQSLVTIIQNTRDNTMIQQINQLDITVQNIGVLQNVNFNQELNFQLSQGLR